MPAKKAAQKAPKTPVKAKAPAKTPVKMPKEPAAATVTAKSAPKIVKLGNYFYANGKRKTSVASVRVFPDGKGAITINNRTFENYFPVLLDQDKIISPIRMSNLLKQLDITVRVHGGGIHSQAEAVRHGISKALITFKPELRSVLKPVGFLTRDSRIKERKKYGLKRARRAPQWQKR